MNNGNNLGKVPGEPITKGNMENPEIVKDMGTLEGLVTLDRLLKFVHKKLFELTTSNAPEVVRWYYIGAMRQLEGELELSIVDPEKTFTDHGRMCHEEWKRGYKDAKSLVLARGLRIRRPVPKRHALNAKDNDLNAFRGID